MALLGWYRKNQRDLPWRRRRDAYGIWISEVMLQQTRVDTVIPYYKRFLDRWPTVADLAQADPEAVRAAWSGLGYYRRAKLMLDAAKMVVAEHSGVLPQTAEALEALPGFGRYTAGAVASIAYGQAVPAVDGNVIRVLARVHGIEGDVTRGEPGKAVHAAAAALAAAGSGDSGDWTQAVMELGATLCTPRSPACGACPVTKHCVARRQGSVDRIPPPKKRAARVRVALAAAVLTTSDGRVWLEQRPSEGLFADLWTPPLFFSDAAPKKPKIEGAKWGPGSRKVTAALTHRDLEIEVYSGTLEEAPFRAVPIDALSTLGLPSVAVKILRAGLPPNTITEHHGRRRIRQLDLI